MAGTEKGLLKKNNSNSSKADHEKSPRKSHQKVARKGKRSKGKVVENKDSGLNESEESSSDKQSNVEIDVIDNPKNKLSKKSSSEEKKSPKLEIKNTKPTKKVSSEHPKQFGSSKMSLKHATEAKTKSTTKKSTRSTYNVTISQFRSKLFTTKLPKGKDTKAFASTLKPNAAPNLNLFKSISKGRESPLKRPRFLTNEKMTRVHKPMRLPKKGTWISSFRSRKSPNRFTKDQYETKKFPKDEYETKKFPKDQYETKKFPKDDYENKRSPKDDSKDSQLASILMPAADRRFKNVKSLFAISKKHVHHRSSLPKISDEVNTREIPKALKKVNTKSLTKKTLLGNRIGVAKHNKKVVSRTRAGTSKSKSHKTMTMERDT